MAQFNERVWVCDTMTGAKRAIIPASTFNYSRVANDGGSGSMTLNVNSPIAQKLNLTDLLTETKNTLVLEADNRIVYAGVIGDPDYDRDAGTYTVEHSDLWTILAARKAIEHGVTNAMIAHLNYGPLSLSTIAKRLLQEAVAPGAQWALPLLLPPDVAGTHHRTYYGYQMQYVADALRELMAVDAGPNIDLNPRWAGDNLQWAPRVGNLSASASTWEWNLDAPNNGASKVGRAGNTSRITTTTYVIGEGSEKNTLYASDPSPDTSYPALERDVAYKSGSNRQPLVNLAMERTRAYAAPTYQWRMSITKDGNGKPGSPRVQDLNLGDKIRIHVANDPILPKGWSEHTLIKYSGSHESNFVQLELQQIGA